MRQKKGLELGMCVLHRDFHEMRGECWEATLSLFLLGYDRDRYQLEVERGMLNDFIRKEGQDHGERPRAR